MADDLNLYCQWFTADIGHLKHFTIRSNLNKYLLLFVVFSSYHGHGQISILLRICIARYKIPIKCVATFFDVELLVINIEILKQNCDFIFQLGSGLKWLDSQCATVTVPPTRHMGLLPDMCTV